MLYVSAVFAVARCLSVHLSRVVYSFHTAEDIVKLLSPPASTITLVFRPPAPIPNSKGNRFSGGANAAKYKGAGKKLRFSTEIAVYLGNGTR